jgi:hypothetical protein
VVDSFEKTDRFKTFLLFPLNLSRRSYKDDAKDDFFLSSFKNEENDFSPSSKNVCQLFI